MALRTAILATAFLGTLATLYHVTTSQTSIMASSSSDQAALDAVTIELSPAEGPLAIKVTIQNNSPDKFFTFLRWDSPFCPTVLLTGVLCIKDAETGDEIEGDILYLNRQLPPRHDCLEEIGPASSATREIKLQAPWIPTDGKKYLLQMRGSWRAAWPKAIADVTDYELEDYGADIYPVDFESGPLEMQLKH